MYGGNWKNLNISILLTKLCYLYDNFGSLQFYLSLFTIRFPYESWSITGGSFDVNISSICYFIWYTYFRNTFWTYIFNRMHINFNKLLLHINNKMNFLLYNYLIINILILVYTFYLNILTSLYHPHPKC